ncbi:MAG TPA: hypothetical protein VF941_03965 [Clostridia bacterium]
MLIFNWVALVEFLTSFALGYVFSKFFGLTGANENTNNSIMTAFAGFFLIVIDLMVRLKKSKASNGKIQGGHIFYIPTFIWGFFWLIFNIIKLIRA